MGLQDLSDHVVQPGGPLVKRALLLQGDLKILLQALDHALVALAHPRSLLLLDNTKRTQHATHMDSLERDESEGIVLPGH